MPVEILDLRSRGLHALTFVNYFSDVNFFPNTGLTCIIETVSEKTIPLLVLRFFCKVHFFPHVEGRGTCKRVL